MFGAAMASARRESAERAWEEREGSEGGSDRPVGGRHSGSERTRAAADRGAGRGRPRGAGGQPARAHAATDDPPGKR